MRARAYLREHLAPRLPRKWRYVDYLVTPENLDRLTVVANASGVERLTQAPSGARDVTVTLCLVSPNDDFEKAEGELEDALETLLDAIESHLPVPWDPASKVLYQDRYLAWEIPLRIITA